MSDKEMSQSEIEARAKFLALAKETEAMHETLKGKYKELKAVMEEMGVGYHMQDPETGAVYKVVVPTGTYVEFRAIDYKRTALPGERGGSPLAKGDAEALGYIIKKKE